MPLFWYIPLCVPSFRTPVVTIFDKAFTHRTRLHPAPLPTPDPPPCLGNRTGGRAATCPPLPPPAYPQLVASWADAATWPRAACSYGTIPFRTVSWRQTSGYTRYSFAHTITVTLPCLPLPLPHGRTTRAFGSVYDNVVNLPPCQFCACATPAFVVLVCIPLYAFTCYLHPYPPHAFPNLAGTFFNSIMDSSPGRSHQFYLTRSPTLRISTDRNGNRTALGIQLCLPRDVTF